MISNSLFEYYTSYTEIGQRKDDQFFFNCSDKEFIGFYRYVAIWTNDQEKYRLRPNKTSLKLAINYLLSNSYFILGNMRYRKLTGILMGSDLPLSMAKVFLCYYKMKWILQKKNKTCKRIVPILLRLKMIYAPSVMMILKIITMKIITLSAEPREGK